MVKRDEKIKEERQNFLNVEKELNSPEKIKVRALRIAQASIDGMTGYDHHRVSSSNISIVR